MPTALLINPNTAEWVTERLAGHLAAMLPADGTGPAIRLRAVTATFGASYIASEAAFAIAAHAALTAYADAAAQGPVDAVLIGCFGDPGLHALREIAPVPVLGLAEASIDEAGRCGRFAIVTGGRAWQPMLTRIVGQFGHAHRLAGITVIDRSGGELAADPAGARRLLTAACRDAALPGVDCVVLGGAAFAGYGDLIAPDVPVPVIDSVSAAARALRARFGTPAARGGTAAAAAVRLPDRADYIGIAPALARRIGGMD